MRKLVSCVLASGAAILGSTVGFWDLLDSRDKPLDILHRKGISAECATVHVTDQRQHGLYNRSSHRLMLRNCTGTSSTRVSEAISKSRELIQRMMLEQGIPGAQIAVSKNGCLVWSEGLGLADVENSVPCSPDSVMRIASISKPLTTVGLLQLWEKGLVDLDAPIQKYVPSFPEKKYDGEKVVITIRQLLAHLSGVRHYVKKGSEDSADDSESKEFFIATHYDTVEEALKLFADDELLSKPGEEYHYSTHAWTLVSAVIENVSGEKFLPYMKKSVFAPLAMSSTGGEFHKPLLYNRARHYVRTKDGQLENVPYVDLSHKWAGGGLVSTAQDLVKFGNAILASFNCSLEVSSSESSDKQKSSNRNTKLETEKSSCVTKLDARNTSLSNQSQDPLPSIASSPTNLQVSGHDYILSPTTTSLMLTKVVDQTIPTKFPRLGYSLGWQVDKGEVGVACGAYEPMFFGHAGGAVGCTSQLLIVPFLKSCSDCSLTRDQNRGSGCNKCNNYVECECVDDAKWIAGYESHSLCGGCDACAQCDAGGVVVCVIFNLQKVQGVLELGVDITKQFMPTCKC